MKNILFVLLVFLLVGACSLEKEAKFSVDGKVKDLQKGVVRLTIAKQEIELTTEIKNGKFSFEGVVSEPGFCVIEIDGIEGKRVFCIENSDIIFEADSHNLSEANISGSKMQADKEAYIQRLEDLKKKYNYDQIDAEWDDASEKRKAELDEIFEQYDAEMWDAKKQFVLDYPDSYYSTIILWDIDWLFDTSDEFFEFISHLNPSLDGYSYFEEIKENFNRLKVVEVGQVAPDFIMQDVEGESVAMSDVLTDSKYLIINFWASSCSSCRIENKNLVKIYDQFHNRGLNIYSISTDIEKDPWLKAIKKDGIGKWTNTCTFKEAEEHEVTRLYALRQQSENLVLDNTGKILLKNVKGEELQEKLAEIMN